MRLKRDRSVTRGPAVAGQFYFGAAARLSEQVASFVDKDAVREEAIGVMVPHAGLIYSGAVAGAVYSSITFPRTFVMLGPNHTGLGPPISLMGQGAWEIPTGRFEIDRKLAAKIALNADVSEDVQAHSFEHSLEVQLPFFAHISREVRIVPISILSAALDDCLGLAATVAAAVKETDYPVVVLASSDMSHFVSDSSARRLDREAIDRLLELDPEGLYETVRSRRITMCGYLPSVVMLAAARLLGAGSARLVKYATSAEVSGDYENVVGYAGIVVR